MSNGERPAEGLSRQGWEDKLTGEMEGAIEDASRSAGDGVDGSVRDSEISSVSKDS